MLYAHTVTRPFSMTQPSNMLMLNKTHSHNDTATTPATMMNTQMLPRSRYQTHPCTLALPLLVSLW